MQWKWILAVLTIIIIFGLWIYQYLGGFNEIKMETVENLNFSIKGTYFEGTYGDHKNRQLVTFYRELLEEPEVKGHFSVVHLKKNKENQDSIFQFMGIQKQSFNNELPDSLTTKNFSISRAIKASITSHPFVRPSPEKVEKKATHFANQQDYQLENYSIEKYFNPRKLEIYFPVKE